MSRSIDFAEEPSAPRRPYQRSQPRHDPSPEPARQESTAAARTMPHSIEAEECLLSCCLIDGKDVVTRCLEARISPESFFVGANAIVFGKLQELHEKHLPIDVAVLGEELKSKKQLAAVGGYAFLTRISGSMPTTTQAGYFVEQVRGYQRARELIRQGAQMIERAYSLNGSVAEEIPQIVADAHAALETIATGRATTEIRKFGEYHIPPPGDPSILLGNRFLCRGDGAILTSQSGMGKSSMVLQAAAQWALGRDFFGVRPNGPLKSLIIQSEDSDGDIGEVTLSISQLLGLTDKEKGQLSERVLIASDRVSRGVRFVDSLRALVARVRPDLVWLNPLLAYFDGDINSAADAGRFLREGLNGVNTPGTFGFIVVHHTAKPPSAKDRSERRWSEVMYDMTGSAELSNWSRAVMSLRPTDTEHHFNLVFAKRGKRAGATIREGTADQFEVVGTSIPVRHTERQIIVPDHKTTLPGILWERRAPDPEEEDGTTPGEKGKRIRKDAHQFQTFRAAFPTSPEKAQGIRHLHRIAQGIRPIGIGAFVRVVDGAIEDGMLRIDTADPARPKYWLDIP